MGWFQSSDKAYVHVTVMYVVTAFKYTDTSEQCMHACVPAKVGLVFLWRVDLYAGLLKWGAPQNVPFSAHIPFSQGNNRVTWTVSGSVPKH